jgi:hypothetical protein
MLALMSDGRVVLPIGKGCPSRKEASMTGRLRFTAVLVVLLVIGLAGMASGNDGDPIIVGQTVTGQTPTRLRYPNQIGDGAGFAVDTVETDNAIEGFSEVGSGVYGSSRGIGVTGYAMGVGVNGLGATFGGQLIGSVGVRAEGAVDEFTGHYDVGLQSIGQVQLSKASGLTKVLSGQRSVTVHVKFDLVPGSMVLVTSQSSGGSVRYVQKNPTSDSFTIKLSRPATKDTLVAWFLISPYPLP